jgi:hypothetical protein
VPEPHRTLFHPSHGRELPGVARSLRYGHRALKTRGPTNGVPPITVILNKGEMQRIRHDQRARPPAIHSIWSHDDSTSELLAIDVFECSSVKAAHDQLIEALGNLESDAVNRRSDKGSPGEIAFGLGDTMILFSRSNVVVLIRNAGPKVVPVSGVARELDAVLVRELQNKRR